MKQIDEMFTRFFLGKNIIRSERWRMFPLIIGSKENGAPIFALSILNHNHLWMIINVVDEKLKIIYERPVMETRSDIRGTHAILQKLPDWEYQLKNHIKRINQSEIFLTRQPMKYDYFNQHNDYQGGYTM